MEASFEDTLTLLTQSEADLRKNIADTTKVARTDGLKKEKKRKGGRAERIGTWEG